MVEGHLFVVRLLKCNLMTTCATFYTVLTDTALHTVYAKTLLFNSQADEIIVVAMLYVI